MGNGTGGFAESDRIELIKRFEREFPHHDGRLPYEVRSRYVAPTDDTSRRMVWWIETQADTPVLRACVTGQSVSDLTPEQAAAVEWLQRGASSSLGRTITGQGPW